LRNGHKQEVKFSLLWHSSTDFAIFDRLLKLVTVVESGKKKENITSRGDFVTYL